MFITRDIAESTIRKVFASFFEAERQSLFDPGACPWKNRLEVAADAALRHGQFTLTLREAD